MSWARLHRWLAIAVVAFLVVWTVTGLLFHLKPGWGRAYDMLSIERPGNSVETFDTAIGRLVRTTSESGTQLQDAKWPRMLSPLDESSAKALVLDAVSRSPYHAEYGGIVATVLTDHEARFRFGNGATVTIGRDDARISQRGPDTDRIDWLYRIHYLQWTGNKSIDRVLAVLGLLLVWAVMIPGVVLFVRAVRRSRQ